MVEAFIHCSVDGCNNPSDRLGYCTAHYMRNRRNGSPTAGRISPGAAVAFLMEAASSETDECILWPYNKSLKTGYGLVKFEGSNVGAHRAALMIRTGLRPDRHIHAAHKPVVCHNRLCINPRHLRWANAKDNEQDKLIDGTKVDGPSVHNASLTADQVRRIRADHRGHTEVARQYGVSKGVIWSIRNRRTYSCVK